MNLLTALRRAAETDAGIMLVSANGADKKIRYAEVYSTARKILGALLHKGVKPGSEVVIQTEDNELFIHLFWACIIGGIIPVPISCGVQAEQKLKLFKVWKYLNDPFLACDDEQFKRLELTAETHDAQSLLNRYLPVSFLLSFEQQGQEAEIEPSSLAYIQFSSGSTGEPKGVCLTHDNLISNTQDIIKSLHITSDDRLLSWMPLTHDMGLIGFLLTGVMQCIDIISIPTALFVRRPLLWMEKTSEHRASVLYSPNFALLYFLSAFRQAEPANWDLHCVRIIVNGAEPISMAACSDFIKALQPHGLHDKVMLSAYGLAEASVEVAAMPPGTALQQYFLDRTTLNIGNEVRLMDNAAPGAVSFADVGHPISDCAVRICDDADEALGENIIGHIQIKGRNVTSGYYNNPAATAAVFTKDQWLRTGDVGFVRNGRMVITGRFKNIIIINGQNYYPKDIEDVLVNAGAAEAGKLVACGIRNENSNSEDLVLFVLHKGPEENLVPIGKKMREVIAQQMGIYVQHVLPIKKLPKTTSGKVQHFALAEQYRNGAFNDYIALAAEQETPAAAQDLTGSLCATANQLLGRNDVNSQTQLMEAGMNSLLAMQFINRAAAITGKEIPAGAIFQCHDIASLVQYIARQHEATALPAIKPQPVAEYYELSLAQKRIWLECQLNKNTVAYNVPVVYHIKGQFDQQLLQQCINELVKKYEILRTSFEVVDGVPRQKVHAYASDLCAFKVVDLRHSSNAVNEAAFFYTHDCNTPFVLRHPAQLRVTVLQLAKDEYIFSFVIHHILTDGWSLQLLFRELCALYNAAMSRNPIELGEPSLQYRDYAAWQNELVQSGVLEPHRAYWLKQLSAAPAAVGLPQQQRQPANAGAIQLDQYVHSFGRESFDRLQTICANNKASRFAVFAALVNVLVHRYTNSKDIVLGFDTAGRISGEMEQLPGYTLNTLCLRTSISPNEKFADLLERVSASVSEALDHQAWPFEQLLADMQAQDRNAPLFDMLLLYQNFYDKPAEISFKGCAIKRTPVFVREGFVNLLLDITETAEGLELAIHYNEQAYSAGFISRVALHIETLLKTLAENDAQPIASCNFLSPEELSFLLPQASHSQPQVPVHKLFERCAALTPNAVAVCAGEARLTYRQLNERANAVAHLLKRKIRLAPNDRVGFMVSRNEKMVVAMLGILKAGAAYVAIDPQYPVGRCQQMVTGSGMKCLLTDSEVLSHIGNHFDKKFLLNIDGISITERVILNPPSQAGMEHLAYVIYTSGSTGKPKGVMISHSSLSAYVQQFIQYFNITGADVVLQQGSVSFDVIVEEIFPALCTSARIVIAEQGGRNINAMLRLITTHKITVLSTTPLVLSQLNEQLDSRIFSLRAVISGGDVLHPSYIDKLFRNVTIYNTYGPSEATVCAAYNKITSLENASMIGKPIQGRRIYILDQDKRLLPKGCTGEMYLEGGLASGYLNLPVQTAAKFIASPFDAGTRLYSSGDMARWTEDDDLEFMGRNDDQVKIRGIRVEPGEVEAAMQSHPQVKLAVVLVHEDKGEKKLVAFIVGKSDYSEEVLRSYLQQSLPAHMRPSAIIELPEIPLNSSGKTDRDALHSRISADTLRVRKKETVLPGTRAEKLVANIWEELLERADISINDDFFDIGGHSLKANQLVNKIYQATGVEINLTDIFTHVTIRQQAELIAQLEQKKFKFIELL